MENPSVPGFMYSNENSSLLFEYVFGCLCQERHFLAFLLFFLRHCDNLFTLAKWHVFYHKRPPKNNSKGVKRSVKSHLTLSLHHCEGLHMSFVWTFSLFRQISKKPKLWHRLIWTVNLNMSRSEFVCFAAWRRDGSSHGVSVGPGLPRCRARCEDPHAPKFTFDFE